MNKVCIITGTRAEYGLLSNIIRGIDECINLELQLVVTGMHLSPEFGMTVGVIESDGFKISRKVEMLLSSDSTVGLTKSAGLGLIGFADALFELQPDLLLIVGDRYETFVAAVAGLIAGVPIAHIHGGETTEGAFDEAFRHSISKMSNLHFVAAEEYRRRVIQLGEMPETVYNVGGLGVDNVLKENLLTREALQDELGIKFLKHNLLITFHPVTFEKDSGIRQVHELLAALGDLRDTSLIFTMPNADTKWRELFEQIKIFCAKHPSAYSFISLGQLRYFSCMKYVNGVVGNSSSGLLEAPSFQIGTVNIGDRQSGRLKATSVIDCEPQRDMIFKALQKLLSDEFQKELLNVKNPYGSGGASQKIVSLLSKLDFPIKIKKKFYDITADKF